MNLDDHTKLLAQLKVEEGFRLYAYADSQGYATIGYGRMVDRRRGGGITLGEAEFLLNNDVYKVIRELSPYAWYEAQDSVRQAALADMAFNLGIVGLLHFPHFLGFMLTKDYPSAIAQLVNTKWHTQVGARADRIIKLIETGAWP